MKRKIIAVICTAALVTSALASCSNAEAKATDDAASAVSLNEDISSNKYEHRLSNQKASESALKTYNYIYDSFGSSMLTCQQESTWMGSPEYEMDYIKKVTGKLPAMRGLDFMNGDFDGVVKRSEEWHEKGGIVTICWHTGINGKGYRESLDDKPDFNKLLDPDTPEHKAMIANWDKAAAALATLRDEDIPVLWRPFHEFDGQWFWWGKGGKDNFIKLWQMMYDYFTVEKELDNLIWVLGYSGDVKDGWYPGDEYCDIIGSDTYDNSTNKKAWTRLSAMGTDKPMAFHECGNVPSVSKFEQDEDLWAWFMIWHTDHIKGNDTENLKAVYNSDKVITLDELPDLR